MNANSKGYVAGGSQEYFYPGAGDPAPSKGDKVLLLTNGCVCIVGFWDYSGIYIAWSPLPSRNREKEKALAKKA